MTNGYAYLRSIAQITSIHVIPELKKRIRSRKIHKKHLPVEVDKFRYIQVFDENSNFEKNIVEINDEVQIQLHVKALIDFEAGQPIYTSDIDMDETFLLHPKVNDIQQPYFLCTSNLFGFTMFFDFKHPTGTDVGEPPVNRFPITKFIDEMNYLEAEKPYDQIEALSQLNWPPSFGYAPHCLSYVKNDASKIKNKKFASIVFKSFGKHYWDNRQVLWEDAGVASGRIKYIVLAVNYFLRGHYTASIYIVVPQIEGIIRDYLHAHGKSGDGSFSNLILQLGEF